MSLKEEENSGMSMRLFNIPVPKMTLKDLRELRGRERTEPAEKKKEDSPKDITKKIIEIVRKAEERSKGFACGPDDERRDTSMEKKELYSDLMQINSSIVEECEGKYRRYRNYNPAKYEVLGWDIKNFDLEYYAAKKLLETANERIGILKDITYEFRDKSIEGAYAFLRNSRVRESVFGKYVEGSIEDYDRDVDIINYYFRKDPEFLLPREDFNKKVLKRACDIMAEKIFKLMGRDDLSLESDLSVAAPVIIHWCEAALKYTFKTYMIEDPRNPYDMPEFEEYKAGKKSKIYFNSTGRIFAYSEKFIKDINIFFPNYEISFEKNKHSDVIKEYCLLKQKYNQDYILNNILCYENENFYVHFTKSREMILKPRTLNIPINYDHIDAYYFLEKMREKYGKVFRMIKMPSSFDEIGWKYNCYYTHPSRGLDFVDASLKTMGTLPDRKVMAEIRRRANEMISQGIDKSEFFFTLGNLETMYLPSSESFYFYYPYEENENYHKMLDGVVKSGFFENVYSDCMYDRGKATTSMNEYCPNQNKINIR